MRLTNGMRGDLIDALQVAIEDVASQMRSNVPPNRRDWNKAERINFEEWQGQKKRWTKLRRAYLKEEKEALHERA